MMVVSRKGLSFSIFNEANDELSFVMPDDSREGRRYLSVIDRRPVTGMETYTRIEPWVFEEIADFLGVRI